MIPKRTRNIPLRQLYKRPGQPAGGAGDTQHMIYSAGRNTQKKGQQQGYPSDECQ